MRETPLWWSGNSGPEVEVERLARAPLPARVDVAIVGGGYTGLSAARSLARTGATVVLLEKEAIGWGASSRNGGQVLTGLKLSVFELVRRYGLERARELHRTSLEAIAFLERLIADERIDCDFTRCGHVEAAVKPAHLEHQRHEQEMLQRDFDHPVRLLERSEQHTEVGSQRYFGVLVDERSGALHPGCLHRSKVASDSD